MKILYGTTNRAKFDMMKAIADAVGFELLGLADLRADPPVIDESGKDPLENAEIKARAYYDAFSVPVFSCDTGLYFDGLDERLQPMTHIKRVNGRELSDDEMTEYYAALSASHGGRLVGRYKNAVYLIFDAHRAFSRMDRSLESEPFIVSSVPHPKKVRGFPLDRLSIHIPSGKYYYDIDSAWADDLAVFNGLKAFFRDALSAVCARR